MQLIDPRPEYAAAIERFERYSHSAFNRTRAFALKTAFRIVVPRNEKLSHSLPWSESKRQLPTRRPRRVRPLVLGYHAVSDGWPSDLAVRPAEFKRQLENLLWRGYRGTTFSQLAAGDCPAKPMAVTFDDGYVSVYENAMPILREVGVPGTIFVPTALIGNEPIAAWPGLEQWSGSEFADELRLLGWDELREMQAQGWEVASHTCTHARLPTLDDEALAAELTDSRQRCSEEMGGPCRTLAFPYGSFDARVSAASKEAGYEAAVTLRPGPLRRYSWPRIGIYNGDDMLRFSLKVSPTLRWLRSTGPVVNLERFRHPDGLAN